MEQSFKFKNKQHFFAQHIKVKKIEEKIEAANESHQNAYPNRTTFLIYAVKGSN